MIDAINAGYRQRFSVITEADIVDWGNENAKLYDYCKDAKGLLDAKEPLSDLLKAKLLKGKLLQLKQEGIDAKTPKGLDKDAIETLTTEQVKDVKAAGAAASLPEKDKSKPSAGRDGPKEKDSKSTSAGAKAPGKAGSASKSEPLPVDPTPPAEVSKRKNKLRDRGSSGRGTDPKLLAIGDEPQDGPDAYYVILVKGVGVLSTLLEELETQVDVVVRVEEANEAWPPPASSKDPKESKGAVTSGIGGPGPSTGLADAQVSVRTTPHPTLSHIRSTATHAPTTSLWPHVALVDLPLPPSGTPPATAPVATLRDAGREMFDRLAQLVYSLLGRRRMYDALYAKDKAVCIPTFDANSPNLLRSKRRVQQALSGMPAGCEGLEEIILGILLEEVCRAVNEGEAEETSSGGFAGGADWVAEIQRARDYFDKKAGGLVGFAKPNSRDRGAFTGAASHGDSLSVVSRIMPPQPSIPIFSPSRVLTRFQIAAARAGPLLLSLQPLADRAAALERTRVNERRGNWETVERELVQFEIGEVCGIGVGEYVWEERMDSHTLAQVLRCAHIRLPHARLFPHPRSEALILCLSGSSVPGQTFCSEFRTINVVTKVGFGRYLELTSSGIDGPSSSSRGGVSWMMPGGKHLMGGRPVYAAGGMVVDEKEVVKKAFPGAGHQVVVKDSTNGI
ncbi:hypothetical protein HDU93_000337, partial [Gonapodya sp. JEL0774]